MKKLHGVITAMTTPFDNNGRIDVKALKAQVEWLISKGVNCLYPTGTTGEMYLMSTEERELVAETVVEQAASRVDVFIHVGAMTQPETIHLAKHAEKIGADGIGVVTPSYFNVFDDGMIDYYKAVCSEVDKDFPVYVYCIPQLAHNDITPECMNKICDVCSNVVGIKYSYPDLRKLMAYMECKGGKLSCVFGADDMFLPALAVGADGTVSGCSGPFPELFVDILKKYNSGDIEGARIAQRKANRAIWIIKAGADMSIFKNVLEMRGVAAGHVRRPLKDMSPEAVSKLKADLKEFL